MAEENSLSKRRDPRYVEKSEDLSDWIQVRLAEQFGEQVEFSGVLLDLTPRAVKVGLPISSEELIKVCGIGKRFLITFRFRNLLATTATATLARIDNIPNGIGLVLFFDFIRESDRDEITKICQVYSQAERNGDEIPSPS